MKRRITPEHDLKATRRGMTCKKCGVYFPTMEAAYRTTCDPQAAAEKADDVETEALAALATKHPDGPAAAALGEKIKKPKLRTARQKRNARQ